MNVNVNSQTLMDWDQLRRDERNTKDRTTTAAATHQDVDPCVKSKQDRDRT